MGRRSARLDEGLFVVEGRGLIAQAVEAGWVCTDQFVGPSAEPVHGAGTVHLLGPNVVERVASTESPQPNLAVVQQRPQALPAGVTFVVVADRLSDPGNAGTIIRSAEAAGAGAVVMTPGSVDQFNPKVVRASAGSLFRVPVVIDELAHITSVVRIGASSHRGADYTTVDLTRPLAIVVGNEAHGLGVDTPVDEWVTIPHTGAAESLNVAMATTVLVFEVARQRRNQVG